MREQEIVFFLVFAAVYFLATISRAIVELLVAQRREQILYNFRCRGDEKTCDNQGERENRDRNRPVQQPIKVGRLQLRLKTVWPIWMGHLFCKRIAKVCNMAGEGDGCGVQGDTSNTGRYGVAAAHHSAAVGPEECRKNAAAYSPTATSACETCSNTKSNKLTTCTCHKSCKKFSRTFPRSA